MNKTKPSADQPDIPHNEPSGGSASGTSPRKESKTAVGQNPVGAAGSEEPIDLDLSKQTLTVDFFKGAGIRDGKNDDLLQTLGELAEDMVGLYRMVSNLEGKITQVIATVSSLQAAQESLSRSVGMELERFKENLRFRPQGIHRTFDFQRADPGHGIPEVDETSLLRQRKREGVPEKYGLHTRSSHRHHPGPPLYPFRGSARG